MLLGGLLTAGGITWWALDRFVVDHVEIEDVNIYERNRTTDTAPLVTFAPTLESSSPSPSDPSSPTNAPDPTEQPEAIENP
jgi:hypothetical protein